MKYTIEVASPDDHIAITAVMRASKAHWGYSKAQMQEWNDEVKVSKEEIENENNHFFKLMDGAVIRGFYSFSFFSKSLAYLDNLFLHPDLIGQGIGQLLFEEVLKAIKEKEADLILLHSDPNAEPFYLKNGFQTIGKKPSSIPNRYLPIMSLSLH